MTDTSLEKIDEARSQGLRPQVVGCFLNNKKILFLFKKEYDLWQLPQGGINNQESIEQATTREMGEELGESFIQNSESDFDIFGSDQVEFPDPTKGSRELKTDAGKKVFMKGKKYFFITIKTKVSEIDIEKTEFDDYKWLDYEEAKKLAGKIYQRGKKRITLNVLELLKEKSFL